MDPSIAPDRLSAIKNFIGFGNPAAQMWFVGLEEAATWHGDWRKDEPKYRRYAVGHFFFEADEIRADSRKHGRGYTKIYDIMSKIIVLTRPGAKHRGVSEADWRQYRDDYLLQEGNEDAFQTNLDPFGKRRSTDPWPGWYSTLFGITEGEWVGEHRPTRDALVRRRWNEVRPRVTVCFGAGSGSRFEDVFGVRTQEWQPLATREPFMAFAHQEQNRLLVITPFFVSYKMSDRRIGDLAEMCRVRGNK